MTPSPNVAAVRLSGDGPAAAEKLSVIIPTLNEAEIIPATLAAARAAGDVELIVVDGGSADGTAEIARAHGAKVLVRP